MPAATDELTLAERARQVSSRQATKRVEVILNRWDESGLASPHWSIACAADGSPLVSFQVSGCDRIKNMPYSSFMLYAQGFNDRRKALINRAPRPA